MLDRGEEGPREWEPNEHQLRRREVHKMCLLADAPCGCTRCNSSWPLMLVFDQSEALP